MSYSITSYSKAKAKKLKVIIKKSTNNKKKIDVFKEVKDKNGKKTLLPYIPKRRQKISREKKKSI